MDLILWYGSLGLAWLDFQSGPEWTEMGWRPRNRGQKLISLWKGVRAPAEVDPRFQEGESLSWDLIWCKLWWISSLFLHRQAEWGSEVRFFHRISGQGSSQHWSSQYIPTWRHFYANSLVGSALPMWKHESGFPVFKHGSILQLFWDKASPKSLHLKPQAVTFAEVIS